MFHLLLFRLNKRKEKSIIEKRKKSSNLPFDVIDNENISVCFSIVLASFSPKGLKNIHIEQQSNLHFEE
jgi:hypothetical protein